VSSLVLTTVHNGGLLAVLHGARGATGSLESTDHTLGLLVGDLAEDDVAAIEPLSLDSGDEELRAVGVGASVGHGQQVGLGVLLLEVLVGELLAVDGLATSAVTTGEVTALEHELGDNAVEGRALVAEALLASAESAEVLGGLGNDVVVELEVDATRLGLDLRGLVAGGVQDGTFPLNCEENLRHGDGSR